MGTLRSSDQAEAERQQPKLRALSMPMSLADFQFKAGTANTGQASTHWSCIDVAPARLIPTLALSGVDYESPRYPTPECK